MSRSATPATRNEATRRLKPPKVTPVAELTIGTPIATSRGCHEKCNTSSENVAKVLRLPHKTTFDTLENTPECHEVPRLPRETKQRNVGNLQKYPKMTTSAELTIGTAIRSSHGRLRTVAAVNATPSEHTLNRQTPRVKREPLLRIREKCACPTSKKLDFADKIEKCMEMREAGRWWRKNHLNIFYLKKSACPISKKLDFAD